MKDKIIVRGARQHNLKGFDLEIPRRAFTVITGPSGSGKSSLAFDTIYAEGQRRYVESLSAYARQFLERMEKPDVDSIDGLSPAVAIEQKNPTKTSRSTVGTATDSHPADPVAANRAAWRVSSPRGYARLGERNTRLAGETPALQLALNREEARFDRTLVSFAGAAGMAPVSPLGAERFGGGLPHDR